jgi:hypothetical protein
MKVYCIDTDCPNKPDGYAICTALMKPQDCPKRLNKDAVKSVTEPKKN